MSTPNDGGPAFPAPYSNHHDDFGDPLGDGGMSLRDYFAGQVLPVLLRDHLAKGGGTKYGTDSADAAAYMAGDAYYHADAMLAEREADK